MRFQQCAKEPLLLLLIWFAGNADRTEGNCRPTVLLATDIGQELTWEIDDIVVVDDGYAPRCDGVAVAGLLTLVAGGRPARLGETHILSLCLCLFRRPSGALVAADLPQRRRFRRRECQGRRGRGVQAVWSFMCTSHSSIGRSRKPSPPPG
jgi:hypothetical protein